jgi:hypothetical protein
MTRRGVDVSCANTMLKDGSIQGQQSGHRSGSAAEHLAGETESNGSILFRTGDL